MSKAEQLHEIVEALVSAGMGRHERLEYVRHYKNYVWTLGQASVLYSNRPRKCELNPDDAWAIYERHARAWWLKHHRGHAMAAWYRRVEIGCMSMPFLEGPLEGDAPWRMELVSETVLETIHAYVVKNKTQTAVKETND